MTRVRLRLEDFETHEEIKAARKLIGVKVKEGMKDAAQRAVLPLAKRKAPAIVAQALTTKAVARGAFLTTLGRRKLDDITGLLNFGGQPRDVIRPRGGRKGRKALAFHVGGKAVVVASVGHEGRPRARYTGQHFLEAAIAEGIPAMEAITAKKIREAFGALAS